MRVCPDKEGIAWLQNPRLANSRRNLGNCRCSAETFSALKREEEKDAQSGKDCLVAEGLGSSGLVSWLCSGFPHNLGKSQFISLFHCSSIITWISPLQHYPLSLSLASICLTCWDYKLCKVQTASDFWFLSVWIWLSLIWFVSVCTVSSNLKQSLWMIP